MSATSDDLSAGVRNTFAAGGAKIRDRQMDVLGNLPFFTSPGKDRRSRAVKENINRDLDNLKDASDSFYSPRGDLSKIYERGLLDGGAPQLTRRDTRILKKLREEGIAEMDNMIAFARRDWRRVNTLIKSAKTPDDLEKKINRSGLRGLRYIDGRMVGIKQYGDMAFQTRSAVAYNRGIIEGGIRGGAKSFTISDGSACGLTRHDDPEKANGMVVSPETALANIIAHPHCITGDAKVEPIGDLLAVYRIPYSGAVVEITTASDHRLTIGPNHPALTSKGWVSAKLLEPGDEIVNSASQIGLAARPDLENVEPTIEDLFNASLTIGAHSTVVAMPDQFHGDGASAYGEVDVVDTNGLVMNALDSSVREKSGEVLFKPAVESSSTLLGGGDPLLVENSVDLPTPSSVSGLHVAGVGGLGANLDTLVSQLGFEDLSPDPILQEHILEAGAGDITLDRIVKVRILDSSVFGKHVYDLETSSGAYIANGTIVHNCQRTFSPSTEKPPDRTTKSRSKSALATVGRLTRQTVIQSAKAGVGAELSSFLRSPQVARFALRVLPGVNEYQRSLDQLGRLVTRSGKADVTPEQVREDIMAWGEEWLEKGILPEYVAEVIGVKVDAPDIAVNDGFYRFSVFRDLDVKNSMSHGDLGDMLDFQKVMYDAMFDYWAGKVEGALPRSRFGHISFPRVPTARPETAAEKAIRAKINADRLRRKLKPIRRRLETQSGFVSRGGRLTLNLEQHIRATSTYRPGRGFINHLSLNPNGMIRMGFATNPDTGLITPSLRLVPPGPIHIGMRLNRSAGRLVKWANITDEDIAFGNSADMRKARAAQARISLLKTRGVLSIKDYQKELNDTIIRIDKGKITSVTAEIRLVTPDWKMGEILDKIDVPGYPGRVLARSKMGLDFSSQLNLDLRKLGLRGLGDIKDLTLDRFKELGLDDLKIVSLAAEYMASGGSPWDLSHIFRIGVDRDVRTFWALVNKYADDQAALGKRSWVDFKASRARRRFIQIEGEGVGGKAINPPPDPPFRVFAQKRVNPDDPDVSARLQNLLVKSKLEEAEHLEPDFDHDGTMFMFKSIEDAVAKGRVPEALLRDIRKSVVLHDDLFKYIENQSSRTLKFVLGKDSDPDWADGAYAYFDQDGSALVINPHVAAEWGSDAMRKGYAEDKAGGWSQPDKGDIADLIVHEMGHWLTTFLSREDHVEIFKSISRVFPEDFPTGERDRRGNPFTLSDQVALFPGSERVKQEIGEYASTNWLEFLAEAWADYTTSAEPSDLSSIVGENIRFILLGGARQGNGLDFEDVMKMNGES